jgi:hypothetical protein
MTTLQRAGGRVISAGIVLLQLTLISVAQKKSSVPDAPVPAQILAAKRIFIVNAGGDEMAENDPIFTGGPDRAYNQFYAAMKSWGNYQIVGSPVEADLLLEVRQEVSADVLGGKAGSSYVPNFRLKIRDPKTNTLLWGFDVHAAFGLGQGASDQNFDQAIERLVLDVRRIAASRLTPANGANTQIREPVLSDGSGVQ